MTIKKRRDLVVDGYEFRAMFYKDGYAARTQRQSATCRASDRQSSRNFRLVFITRVIEGMSVEETAEILGIQPETVKTRLHRARKLIREQLDKQIGPVLMDAFPFAGKRCERVTEAVLQRLGFSR